MGLKMTEKRYYVHKHLLQENKVYDKICHNFMNIDETVEHMNSYYWKYKQLKRFKIQVAEVIESKMEDNICNDYKMEVLKEMWNELELDEVWFK